MPTSELAHARRCATMTLAQTTLTFDNGLLFSWQHLLSQAATLRLLRIVERKADGAVRSKAIAPAEA